MCIIILKYVYILFPWFIYMIFEDEEHYVIFFLPLLQPSKCGSSTVRIV